MHELTEAGEVPLTVSTLVSRAGISRSSFYAQFASIDQLALEMLRGALADITAAGEVLRNTAEVSNEEFARASVGRLVAHVDENRVLYRSVLNIPVSYREAVKTLETELRVAIPRVPASSGQVEHGVAAAYMAGGTVAVLSGWLHDPDSRTRDDVTEQMLALLPSWIAGTPGPASDAKTSRKERKS
jgi:AcrR family transcriptional regulator